MEKKKELEARICYHAQKYPKMPISLLQNNSGFNIKTKSTSRHSRREIPLLGEGFAEAH